MVTEFTEAQEADLRRKVMDRCTMDGRLAIRGLVDKTTCPGCHAERWLDGTACPSCGLYVRPPRLTEYHKCAVCATRATEFRFGKAICGDRDCCAQVQAIWERATRAEARRRLLIQ